MINSGLSSYSLFIYIFGVKAKKGLPNSKLQRLNAVFTFRDFYSFVSYIRVSDLDYFFLFFEGSNSILFHVDIQLSQHYLLTRLFFLVCLGILVKNQWTVNVRIYLWTLNSISFTFHKTYPYVNNTLSSMLYCYCKIWSQEIQVLQLYHLIQYFFGCSTLLVHPYEF